MEKDVSQEWLDARDRLKARFESEKLEKLLDEDDQDGLEKLAGETLEQIIKILKV